jgi:hypothetical protein
MPRCSCGSAEPPRESGLAVQRGLRHARGCRAHAPPRSRSAAARRRAPSVASVLSWMPIRGTREPSPGALSRGRPNRLRCSRRSGPRGLRPLPPPDLLPTTSSSSAGPIGRSCSSHPPRTPFQGLFRLHEDVPMGPLLSSPLATIPSPGRPDLRPGGRRRRGTSLMRYPRGARSFRARTHGLGATARPYPGAGPAWRTPTSSRWRRRSAGSS